MDLFLEYIIKRKRGVKENILTLVIILSVPSLVYLSLILLATPLAPLTLFVVAGIIFLAYYLISRMNVEFEYIITNNELDIDKIIARKTRKRLITIDLRKIDFSAPATTSHTNELSKSATNVIYADSGLAENAYFINFEKDGQTYRVFYSPTEKMVDAMKMYAPGKVFEE